MADAAVCLNISEMIDLAIGTPEIGVVDFGMLQTVLHCLAQQQRVLGKNVELRGSVAALPVGRENQQTIAISEFVVDTEEGPRAQKKTTDLTPVAVEQSDHTILVVERVKKSESPINISPTRAASSASATTPSPAHTTTTHAPASEPGHSPTSAPARATSGDALASSSPTTASASAPPLEKLSLVTLSKFNLLENAVADLKDRVYGSIPKNETIIEEVRSQTNLKAITDMWTSLNVSSRLEAAEAGLGKLSSLVQDLINESQALQDAMQRKASLSAIDAASRAAAEAALSGQPPPPTAAAAAPASHTPAPSATTEAAPKQTPTPVPSPTAPPVAPTAATPPVAPTTASPAASPAAISPPPASASPATTNMELENIKHAVEILRKDLTDLQNAFYVATDDIQLGMDTTPTAEQIASPQSPAPEQGRASPQIIVEKHVEKPRLSFSQITAGIMERISVLEKKLRQCCDQARKNDGVITDQLNNFQDQLDHLLKQTANITSDGPPRKLPAESPQDLQGLMELFKTVQDMQEQLKQVNDAALQLAAEKEDRQHHMNSLLEQIELLKIIKLDREDMVEAMAEKADLRLLARKVSHDQFEMACDDLSKGLEHALGKLNMQEALWQQALDDIQREIETKLDKMELSPVKDFFNSKLRQLQENLKQMASLRREAEAAGTKRKLLRDVNCISCDANAVMKMEEQTPPIPKPLPANLSMKPYLSYELDAIRKSQQSNMQQRNMHDWENIDKQMQAPTKTPQKAKSESGKHTCNRYCGGSHTVTTPAQRVARLGHFIRQWGPDVLPLSSGLATGDDGRMYKVTTTEAANVGPGGAVDSNSPRPAKKGEPSKPPPQKQPLVPADCRCLDGQSPDKLPNK